MKIKLIAVDMDGTFLDDRKQYDRPRFMAQYQAMVEQGIRFVVASGNQYYQLISFFPTLRHQIAFVAENGAFIYDGDEQVRHASLSREAYLHVLDALDASGADNYVICGLNSAWYARNAPQAFIDLMSRHYHRLQPVDNPRDIDDTIFKFSLNLPDQDIPALINQLSHTLDGIMTPVTSGFGFVDLIIPGAHKGSGLQCLLDRWHIAPQACVAIGDSGNDIEMLKLVGYPVAMANAVEQVKDIARIETRSNNHDGVLRVIDDVLNRRGPFA
ncbi:HAD family hydrolase [Shimwellia pseudoproteus]|uniref:Cof-type HAD-IIB family hydrolase n=1 Tax=Shimwellia pseudoproteus TaxID=570012 RepID=UPI0018EA6BAD|nr:Cof-type HAD-IIB family hydrolase [Shimwellia pseudoproteus]MBJ3813998.1 HAD family hydrolase [Shimwellia pseudoproteus]